MGPTLIRQYGLMVPATPLLASKFISYNCVSSLSLRGCLRAVSPTFPVGPCCQLGGAYSLHGMTEQWQWECWC